MGTRFSPTPTSDVPCNDKETWGNAQKEKQSVAYVSGKKTRKQSENVSQKVTFPCAKRPFWHLPPPPSAYPSFAKREGSFSTFLPKTFLSCCMSRCLFGLILLSPVFLGALIPPLFVRGSVSVCNFPVRRRKHLDMEFSAKRGKPTMVDDMVPRSDFFLDMSAKCRPVVYHVYHSLSVSICGSNFDI